MILGEEKLLQEKLSLEYEKGFESLSVKVLEVCLTWLHRTKWFFLGEQDLFIKTKQQEITRSYTERRL
jgi:hypothetical protein